MNTVKPISRLVFLFLSCLLIMVGGAFAQQGQTEGASSGVDRSSSQVSPSRIIQQQQDARIFTARVRVADSVTLVSDTRQIKLWGVDAIGLVSPVFELGARTALANAIGANPIECETKAGQGARVSAQCVSSNDLDLGLFMLQQGYVSVDRAAVFNTIFEDAYVQAEMQAQDQNLGIWDDTPEVQNDGQAQFQSSVLLVMGFVLFLCVIGIFTFLSIIIMRGFRNVIEAQNDNLDMMSRERKLRDKERGVVAVMLSSELKANKAKIEAYLVVYEEMLKSLKNSGAQPKYKTAGDLVQKQPVLSRSVFDRNTDKIDMLGQRLASDMIHFYARIKSNPEYYNLEPEMEISEAIKLVGDVIERAKTLNQLADELLDRFEKTGVMSEVPDV